MRTRHNQATYPDSICFRPTGTPILRVVSQTDIEHLYGHTCATGSFHPSLMGTLFGLSYHGTVQRLFSICFRNRKYTYRIGNGTLCIRGLCHIYQLHHPLLEGRCRCMLDNGTPLCHPHFDPLPLVHKEGQLAEEKDITSLPPSRKEQPCLSFIIDRTVFGQDETMFYIPMFHCFTPPCLTVRHGDV